MQRRTRWAAVGALLLALGASGCTGSDDPPDAAPSTEPGRPLETVSADGLPEAFPRDEVPLVDGEVTSVQGGTKKDPSWSVAVVVDAAPAATVADAVELLTGAGWTATTDLAGDPPPVQLLNKGKGQVILTNAVTRGQTLISYTIDLP